MQNIILVGGGGHCESVIEIIESQPELFKITGILDTNEGEEVSGYKVIGSDELIPQLVKDNVFLITVGSIKTTRIREKIAESIKKNQGAFPVIIAKTSTVSKRSVIGIGTVVLHNATINANVTIGEQCIINTSSNIEHDCRLGDFVHVSTGAMVNGGCQIGNRCFIGSNSTISQGISICDDVIIGAGAVVVKDIIQTGTYVGNPARKLEKNMCNNTKKFAGGGYISIVKSPSQRRFA